MPRAPVALAALAALAIAAGCYSEAPMAAPTGTPTSAATSGVVYEFDFAKQAAGPPPFLGASEVVVADGMLQLTPTAETGRTSLPYDLRGADGTASPYDSVLSVTATVPFGAQIVIGRGRLRDNSSQAGLGVIFAPASDATRPSGFLVALGLGRYEDPRDGQTRALACGGSPFGLTYIQRNTVAGVFAAATHSLDGFIFDLQKAPQLVNLASDTKEGGVHAGTAVPTSATYEVAFAKKGDGVGTVLARHVVGPVTTEMFGGAFAVDKAKTAGVSMACKLSYIQCSLFCESGAGPLLFGGGCDTAKCANGAVATDGDPEALDFQDAETCRQASKADESCAAPLNPASPTATAYRIAVNEVFKDSADTNQFLIQLVRSKTTGASPTVTSIKITR